MSTKSETEKAHTNAVNKIWTGVGVLSTYLNVNVLLASQGSHLYLPAPVPEDAGEAAVIYGTWLAGPPLLILLWITIYCAKRSTAHRWHLRFPLAFDLPLCEHDTITAWYQRFFFFCLIVLPLYCQGHFLRNTLNGKVFESASKNVIAKDWSSHLFNYSRFSSIFMDGDAFRFADKVSFFPFWQPWLTLIAFLLMCWLSVRLVLYLRR